MYLEISDQGYVKDFEKIEPPSAVIKEMPKIKGIRPLFDNAKFRLKIEGYENQISTKWMQKLLRQRYSPSKKVSLENSNQIKSHLLE